MIALDVETTGLDPERNSILSIGALDTEDPSNEFYGECRAWEGAHITDEALAVNGFSREEAEGTEGDRVTEAELVHDFVAWVLDRPLNKTILGQNSSFDRDFVGAACRRAGIATPFPHRTLDTHSLVWLHMTLRGLTPPLEKNRSAISLGYALQYCGLPEEPKPHNALTGAYCHAEVGMRIAYNRKILTDFEHFDIPWLMNKDA